MRLEERVRNLLKDEKFDECRKIIENAMAEMPDSPIPQNLMGIVEERRFEKDKAIRHYRASYSLDPTYAPALWNLQRLGTDDFRQKDK